MTTSTTKHTPGPWRLGSTGDIRRPYIIKGQTGAVCAEIYWDQMLVDDDAEPEANARLIAAAPDLLDDAKKLVNEVSGMMGAFELRQLIGNTNFRVLQERWEKMRETIAKAEGHAL